MIDYFALALGHGLLAVALLRLMLRASLDVDPLITDIQTDTADNRKVTTRTGRNAARAAIVCTDETPTVQTAQQ